jgi:hypothetical protein
MQPHEHSSRNPAHVRLAVRLLAAALIVFVGADHYYEYAVDQYRVLPTIGTLFLLNFVSASAVGLLLLAPLERVFPRRGSALTKLAALSGFGIATTSLAALLVSEQTPLFGFMELNYRPAILVALVSEAAAGVATALFFALSVRASRSPKAAPRAGVAASSHAGVSASPPNGHREGFRLSRVYLLQSVGVTPALPAVCRDSPTATERSTDHATPLPNHRFRPVDQAGLQGRTHAPDGRLPDDRGGDRDHRARDAAGPRVRPRRHRRVV